MKLNKKIIFIVIAVIMVVVFLVSAYVFTEINGTFKKDENISIKIEQGDSVKDIASNLSKNKAISNSMIFPIYYKIANDDRVLKPGNFIVNPKEGYSEIITVISGQSNDPNASDKLTVIEGENLVSIGDKLEKKGVCTRDEFLIAINKDYGFNFQQYVEPLELKLFLNEGYAFPDTYHIDKNSTAEDVAKMMFANFDKKFKPEYYERMKEMDMNFEEVIALASVIQHEASTLKDMKMVSSVFHNRLNSSGELSKLQSDVTVFYARDIVGKYTNENQDQINAYSTYLSSGIPVGPICNPGMDAIEAALYPDDTNYYYFLTDLNAKFYYAETFEEHLKYNEEAEKINEQVKKDTNKN